MGDSATYTHTHNNDNNVLGDLQLAAQGDERLSAQEGCVRVYTANVL